MSGKQSKTNHGNFFEDFRVGQKIIHGMPITISAADTSNSQGLYGSRLTVCAADSFAKSVGYEAAPVSNMVVFHKVFGLTVPDISQNAVANLGYAEVRFTGVTMPGDTLTAATEVIGQKQNSNGATGNVYVHTTARNQNQETVLSFKRWVMVRKSDQDTSAPDPQIPDLAETVDPARIVLSPDLQIPKGTFDPTLSGSRYSWDDYSVGEKIDHGISVEMGQDHMFATRLAGGNSAAVHFNSITSTADGAKARLIYGGHVMQHAFAHIANGLGNALDVVAINGGAHTAPTFEGDSLQSYSEVLDKAPLADRDDLALLRIRTVTAKNLPKAIAETFPYRTAGGKYEPSVVLDLDYWVVLPTEKSMQRGSNAPANHRLNVDRADPVFTRSAKPERAVHFFPPHNEKMRGKAAELIGKVDVLLGNFEDGVEPAQKAAARHGFIEFCRTSNMGDTGLWTRINALDTEWGLDDVQEVVSAVGDKLDVIMLPMVRNAGEVRQLERLLTMLEAEHEIAKPIQIHAILETGDGIVNVNAIAAASPRMHGMSFGPADYAASLGIKTQDVGGSIPAYGVLASPPANDAPAAARGFFQQDVWHYHISAMVAACRAYGLKPMYGPFGNFGDPDACRQQYLNAYLMGCEGAWTLHPAQIDIALDVFAPDADDVAVALDRIKTFGENGGQSYYERNTGKFVDEAVIKQADVFVALAQQLADKDPKYASLYGLQGAT